MSKTLMLAAILLLSAAWIQAQEDHSKAASNPSAGSPTSASQDQGKSDPSSSQTVEGCLQGSNGSFTLTDKSGTTWQLAGDTSKLTEHVGHEVQIKGSTGGASPTGAGAAAGGQQTLTVESVKHVAKTCKSAGGK